MNHVWEYNIMDLFTPWIKLIVILGSLNWFIQIFGDHPCLLFKIQIFYYFHWLILKDDMDLLTQKSKSNVISMFRSFHAWITNNFNTSIGTFHSDNAKEYLSHAFTQYLLDEGIESQTSCPCTLNKMVLLKRKLSLEVAQCLLFTMNVPTHYWSNAQHAI